MYLLRCGDGTDHTVFIDTNIMDANEGILMDLQGGGECNNIDECKGRCPENSTNGLCTATKDGFYFNLVTYTVKQMIV